MRLPGAVGILHPHHEDAPVAVDVLLVQTLAAMWEGIGPDARSHEPRPVCERQLCAVGVEARDDVEGPGVEDRRDARVAPVAAQEMVDEVKGGGAAGYLVGVDICIEPQLGLLPISSHIEVRGPPQARCRVPLRTCRSSPAAAGWDAFVHSA